MNYLVIRYVAVLSIVKIVLILDGLHVGGMNWICKQITNLVGSKQNKFSSMIFGH